MTTGSIQPISRSNTSAGIDPTQTAALNNNQITSMLVSGNIDPKFATLLINQMTSNNVNSILFGDNTNDGSSGSDSTDIFGMQGMVPSNLQAAGASINNDAFGASAFGGVTPQFELSVYSTLIGKTVSATDPLGGQQIEGKVSSVTLQNGNVVLDINGRSVPTNNIIRIM